MRDGFRGWARPLAAAVLFLLTAMLATPAMASDVVITRDVTVRAEPARKGEALSYPAIGTALTLLDDGRRVHGYYHVRLPDGRDGWVYYTFVRRTTGGEPESLLPSGADQIAVHYIDVDQGGAALLEFPCGAILIDAGGRGAAAGAHLISYLEAFFARRPDLNRRLDAVFVTHPHQDHNENLKAVVAAFRIGGFIDDGRDNNQISIWMRARIDQPPRIPSFVVNDAVVAGAGTAGVTNSVIDPVACPRVDPEIRVLSGGHVDNPAWPKADNDNPNNHSLVIRIDYGQLSFLFTGDLEKPAIADLLARYRGTSMLDTDVWEPGHHGAENGTTDALLAAITPKLAVISMGRRTPETPKTAWDYGHPRIETLQALERVISAPRVPIDAFASTGKHVLIDWRETKAIYATGWDGDVTVVGDATGRFAVRAGQ